MWISVKDELPSEDTIVKIKMEILFISTKSKNIRALYLKKHFILRGEKITKWVTHWQPIPESPDE